MSYFSNKDSLRKLIGFRGIVIGSLLSDGPLFDTRKFIFIYIIFLPSFEIVSCIPGLLLNLPSSL